MTADDATTAARALASLVVVVVLVVVSARLARRASGRGDGPGLRVVDRVGLTRETAIAVVEVGGRGLVVGTSAHGVTLLTELEPAELAAARRERRGTDPGRVGVTRVVAADTGAPRAPAQTRADSPAGRTRTASAAAAPNRTAAAARAGTRTAPVPEPRSAGTGSVLDPRTWRQGVDAVRDLTVRRG